MALEELCKVTIGDDTYTIINLGDAGEIMQRRRPGLRICPFCKKPISVKDGNLILVSSTSDMPNKIIHGTCYNEQSHSSLGGVMHCIDYLVGEWEAAQEYAHWFE